MEHEMTLFHTIRTNRNVLLQIHLIFVTMYGLCGHLLTKDAADQLECGIGYATSLYLVMCKGPLLHKPYFCRNMKL